MHSAVTGGEQRVAPLLRRLGFTVMNQGPDEITVDELVDRVAHLRVNRASGRPALYQPITLLWAIGRARRGEDRITAWAETERSLQGLLQRHGAHGERPRPDYPVAALYHAVLWELAGHAGEVPRAQGDSELRRWFAVNRPAGGLPQAIYGLVRQSGVARVAVIDTLLESFFTDVDASALLQDVGLFDDAVADDIGDPGDRPARSQDPRGEYERLCRVVGHRGAAAVTVRMTRDPVRSAAARRAVLIRSEGTCENPGCAGQPKDVTDRGDPILEVDHIDELALGGRDHPEQMIALCPNCHAVKTRGRTREQLRQVLLSTAERRHMAWQPPT
jgi:5-methylcytosine-specific restriction protein A